MKSVCRVVNFERLAVDSFHCDRVEVVVVETQEGRRRFGVAPLGGDDESIGAEVFTCSIDQPIESILHFGVVVLTRKVNDVVDIEAVLVVAFLFVAHNCFVLVAFFRIVCSNEVNVVWVDEEIVCK